MKHFALSGIHVVGLARRKEKVEEFAKNIGETLGKIYAIKCDVSNAESVKEAFKWIEEKFESISIIVNNAAILYAGLFLDEREDASKRLTDVINTNFTGAVNVTREAVRLIKKTNDFGMIININSIAGHSIPFGKGVNVYAPTKHAMTAMSEVLRQELVTLNNSKIRVSNLSPGVVKTDMAVAAGMVTDRDLIYEHLPHLQPEDVAQAVMFLLETPTTVNITQLTIKPVGETA